MNRLVAGVLIARADMEFIVKPSKKELVGGVEMMLWMEIAALSRSAAALICLWFKYLSHALVVLHSAKPAYSGPRMHRVCRNAAGWGEFSGGNRHPLAKPD